HELLRQYAAEQLRETGEMAADHCRHLQFFSALAEQAEAHLYTPQQEVWFDRLELELDNLQAALAWTLRDKEAEAGLRLAAALGWFWELRTHHREGYQWLKQLLAMAGGVPASVQMNALGWAGSLALFSGEYQAATTYVEASLVLAREAGDKSSIAWA